MFPSDSFSAAISAVLAAALDCVICIDDDGRVSEWNPAAERVFGWRRDEAMGVDLAELIIPPEFREAHRAGRERYRRTREAHVLGRRVELPALRKDGTRLMVELTITEVESPTGRFFTAYLRDLTLRNRNDMRRDAQYRVASLLAGAEGLEEIAGEVLQTLASIGDWQFGSIWLVERDGMLVVAHTWHAERRFFPQFEAETRRLRLGAEEGFPGRILASGKPGWLQDAALDLGFVRRAAAAAEGLHGAFGFPLCVGGRALGVVELLSVSRLPPDEDLLALSTALGRNIGQFMQRGAALAALQAKVAEVEEQRRIAQGQRFAAEAANAAKDRFLATLSHELRTPLTPLLLWTSSGMEADPTLSPDLRDALRMIRSNVELEARLIDDLLDFSRLAHHKMQLHLSACDAHDLLREVARMLAPELAGREVRWELRAENPRITGDPVRLKQIFWNLLRNAAKFTPRGGTITITSANEPGALRVAVADTGAGIAPALLERIFDPFEQGARPAAGGLGLGLAIARNLVALHDGKLTAASEGPGRGATFEVSLPCCADEATGQPATRSVAGPLVECWRILIVEDHAATRETLASLLIRAGHYVAVAGSLAEGRRVLAEEAPFDLLLTDLGLPDGNGAALLAELPPGSRTRAVAVSGYGEEHDREHSEGAGFAMHLMKPISMAELKAALRELQLGGR